jgi:hypothetical protein
VYVRADVKMSIDIDTALQAADEFDHQFKT